MHRFVSGWGSTTRGRLLALTLAVAGVLVALSALGGRSPATTAAQSGPGGGSRVAQSAGRPPLLFIENAGQFPAEVRYQVFGAGGSLLLTPDAVWIVASAPATPPRGARGGPPASPDATAVAANTVALRLSLPGANTATRIEPFNRADTRVSYYTGGSPSAWRVDVPVWGGVRYVDIYPGIDLEISGASGDWQWSLRPRVAQRNRSPLTGLATPRLQIEGADNVALERGGLRLDSAAGSLRVPLLGGPAPIAATPSVQPSGRGFSVDAPFATTATNEPSAPAAPQAGAADLVYSTFIGGSLVDETRALALDGAGNAYLTGTTFSPSFPPLAPGVIGQACPACSVNADVFVVKFDTTASALGYATFLGGTAVDEGRAIAVTGTGVAYITGTTKSLGFPTSANLDTSCGGCQDDSDAFVVKLNEFGGFAYGTYIGGQFMDEGNAITVDGSENVWVGGETENDDLTLPGTPFDPSYGGTSDGFVLRLNGATGAVTAGTYVGGAGRDAVTALDNEGGLVAVGGFTESSDFPTSVGAYKTQFGGMRDGFVAKLGALLNNRTYASLLGGADIDEVAAIVLDSGGAAYVTGHTYSNNFPTTMGALDTTYNGNLAADAFVVKLNAAGSNADYATYLGGAQSDYGTAITVDGNLAYVAGTTASTDVQTTGGAFQTAPGGLYDGFVVKLDATGTTRTYATYIGGSNDDQVAGIAIDGTKIVHVAGSTRSGNFPTTEHAYDRSHNGGVDAFAAALNINGSALPATPTPTPTPTAQPTTGPSPFTIVKNCTSAVISTAQGSVQCAIGITAATTITAGDTVLLRLNGSGQARFTTIRVTASQLLDARTEMPGNGAQSASITCFFAPGCSFGPESIGDGIFCDPDIPVPALLNGIWTAAVPDQCVIFIEETLTGVTPGTVLQSLEFTGRTGFNAVTVNVIPNSGTLTVQAPATTPTATPTPTGTPPTPTATPTPTTIPSPVLAQANCTSVVVPVPNGGTTTCVIGLASTGGTLITGSPIHIGFGGAGKVRLDGVAIQGHDLTGFSAASPAGGGASISIDCFDFTLMAGARCDFVNRSFDGCVPALDLAPPAPGLPNWNPNVDSCVILIQVVLAGVSAGGVQIQVDLPATTGFSGASFLLTPASGALAVAATPGGGTVTISGAGTADETGVPDTNFAPGEQIRYTYTLNNTGGSSVQVALDRFLIGPGYTSVTHHDVIAPPGTTTGFITEFLPVAASGLYRACLRISHNGTSSEAAATFTINAVGVAIPTGTSGCLAVTGTVTLQGRLPNSPAAAGSGPGFSFAFVSIPSVGAFPVAPDGSFAAFGVTNGSMYNVTAQAPGYLSAVRNGVAVGAQGGDAGSVQLKAGLVNGDTVVNISDITALIAAFGSRPPARVVNGNVVDLNADGVVNINDITLALGNFGKMSPLPWPAP